MVATLHRQTSVGVSERLAAARRALSDCDSEFGSQCLAGFALVLGLPGPGSGGAATIETERTFEHPLEVWFDTLSVVGAAAPSQDFVMLSDRVTQGIRSTIDLDLDADGRVKNLSDSLLTLGQTDIEWVLGQNPAPANFPAQHNLVDAYAAAGLALAALFGPGSLTPFDLVASESSYLLNRIETTEDAPATVGYAGRSSRPRRAGRHRGRHQRLPGAGAVCRTPLHLDRAGHHRPRAGHAGAARFRDRRVGPVASQAKRNDSPQGEGRRHVALLLGGAER